MIGRLLRYSIGALFILAALGKFATLSRATTDDLFLATIGPSATARGLFCATEALLGLWLLTGIASRGSLIASLILCSAFVGVLGAELRKPFPRQCGCFGVTQRDPSLNQVRAALVRSVGINLTMMIGAGIELNGVPTRRIGSGKENVLPQDQTPCLHTH